MDPQRGRLSATLDVSGSMRRTRACCCSSATAAMAAGRRVEVFVLWDPPHRGYARPADEGPDRAMHEIGRIVADWEGGTRIGESLKSLLDGCSERAALRGAVVVLCSDGLERGDPDLRAQMARLRRLAYRVVWANPLKGSPRYEPSPVGWRPRSRASTCSCPGTTSRASRRSRPPWLPSARRRYASPMPVDDTLVLDELTDDGAPFPGAAAGARAIIFAALGFACVLRRRRDLREPRAQGQIGGRGAHPDGRAGRRRHRRDERREPRRRRPPAPSRRRAVPAVDPRGEQSTGLDQASIATATGTGSGGPSPPRRVLLPPPDRRGRDVTTGVGTSCTGQDALQATDPRW